MNIEQANAIPMTEILQRLHMKPEKIRRTDHWYLSPLRQENTASFKVSVDKNLWYDFGEGKGGDTVAFVCAYLRSSKEADTVHDALRWLDNMTGARAFRKLAIISGKQVADPVLVLKASTPIEHLLLTRYIESRGISPLLAKKYLKQLRIYNTATKKSFFALGFPNEDDGYEVRNPFFKSCLGPKMISFIRGADTSRKGLHVFEGSFDFLSALEARGKLQFNDDTIVLNSTSCVERAFPFIKNYGYRIAYTWMDHDKAGDKARHVLQEFFQSQDQLRHTPMGAIYKPHKDVNAWHMHKLGLEG